VVRIHSGVPLLQQKQTTSAKRHPARSAPISPPNVCSDAFLSSYCPQRLPLIAMDRISDASSILAASTSRDSFLLCACVAVVPRQRDRGLSADAVSGGGGVLVSTGCAEVVGGNEQASTLTAHNHKLFHRAGSFGLKLIRVPREWRRELDTEALKPAREACHENAGRVSSRQSTEPGTQENIGELAKVRRDSRERPAFEGPGATACESPEAGSQYRDADVPVPLSSTSNARAMIGPTSFLRRVA
jgi:hypothetical protein